MPINYKYKRLHPLDGSHVCAIIERDLGTKVLGLLERGDEVTVHFEAELTGSQKSKLDQIMCNPPQPVRYEYGSVGLEELIEAEVGVKPVRVVVDEATEHVTVDFESPLTPQQEARLENTLKTLRRLKKQK